MFAQTAVNSGIKTIGELFKINNTAWFSTIN